MTRGKRRFLRLLAAGMCWVDGRWLLTGIRVAQSPELRRLAELEPIPNLDAYWVTP